MGVSVRREGACHPPDGTATGRAMTTSAWCA